MAETIFYGSKNLVGIGNVGIGTTNPAVALDVYTGTMNAAAVTATTNYGKIAGANTASFSNILCASGLPASIVQGSNVFVFSNASGFSNVVVMNSLGQVGIGTTNPVIKLDVYGTSQTATYTAAQAIGNSGGTVFHNCASGVGGAGHVFCFAGGARYFMDAGIFGSSSDGAQGIGDATRRFISVYALNGTIQTSDSRFKDSSPLNYGLTEILQTNTILYSWKTQADLPDTDPSKNFKYFGVCADQLAEIMPELCYNEDANVQVQINYSELVPVCINAIKELSAKLQTAQNDIDLLESRLAAIEALISTNTSVDTGSVPTTGTRAEALLAQV